MPCGWRRPSWVAGSWRAGREIALGFLLQERVKDPRRPARSFLREPSTGGLLPAPGHLSPWPLCSHGRTATQIPRCRKPVGRRGGPLSDTAARPCADKGQYPKGHDLCTNQIQIKVHHSPNGSLSQPPPSSAHRLPCQPRASACMPSVCMTRF